MITDNDTFIALASSDLKASEVLLKNECYPQALFYFQQSIEKTGKYIAINTLKISDQQLKKEYSHDIIKVFKKMLAKLQSELSSFDNASHDFSVGEHDLTNLQQFIRSNSAETVTYHTWNQITEIAKMPLPIPPQNKGNLLDALIGYYSQTFGIDVLEGKPMSDLEKAYAESALRTELPKYINNINLGSKILPLLLMVSLFMSRYRVDDYRYASETVGNPVEYFNSENEYVKRLPSLIKLHKGILEFIVQIDWDVI